MSQPVIDRKTFISQYAERSGVTPEWLEKQGHVALRCHCAYKRCQGWQMVNSDEVHEETCTRCGKVIQVAHHTLVAYDGDDFFCIECWFDEDECGRDYLTKGHISLPSPSKERV